MREYAWRWRSQMHWLRYTWDGGMYNTYWLKYAPPIPNSTLRLWKECELECTREWLTCKQNVGVEGQRCPNFGDGGHISSTIELGERLNRLVLHNLVGASICEPSLRYFQYHRTYACQRLVRKKYKIHFLDLLTDTDGSNHVASLYFYCYTWIVGYKRRNAWIFYLYMRLAGMHQIHFRCSDVLCGQTTSTTKLMSSFGIVRCPLTSMGHSHISKGTSHRR